MMSKYFIVIWMVTIILDGLIGLIETTPWYTTNTNHHLIQSQSHPFQLERQLAPTFWYTDLQRLQPPQPTTTTTFTTNAHQRIVLFPASNPNAVHQRQPAKIQLKPAHQTWNAHQKATAGVSAGNKPTTEQWNHTFRKSVAASNPSSDPWTSQPSVQSSVPGSYTWGYRWLDESGNQMFREESNDGLGTVRGRYSFRDASGLIRIVEYIADSQGYRTRIRSNEPGIVTSNPAGAEIIRFEGENIPLKK